MDIVKSLAQFLFSKVVFVVLGLFCVRLVVLTGLEKMAPARPVSYKTKLPRDTLVLMLFIFALVPASEYLNRWISYQPTLPPWVMEWPLAIRLILYAVVADFGAYWVHRLVHTRHLWRSHKWHHSPTYMYWLAGNRVSLVELTIQNTPYIAAGAFIAVAPKWVFWAVMFKAIAENDFMHLNMRLGNRWLEWFIVTPRYHHVHHSDNPAHFNRNFAALLTIWDRLFGTYLDPEKVQGELSFGIGESVPATRMIIGV